MKSTVELFRKMYEELPPLFPAETRKKMNHALLHLEKDSTLTVKEVEDTMIVFGYEVWPWLRAYREFFVMAETRIGEHFLISRLSRNGQRRYQEFLSYGGTLNDLRSGKGLDFFLDEDQQDFRKALIELRREIKDYTDRMIIGLEKDKYFRRVEEFSAVLTSLKSGLDQLNKLADEEQDHPAIADEIRSKVRSFEYGLCFLGPEQNLEIVNNLPEHFAGRRSELQRMRGINLPGEFVLED
jgi:predicted Zn-dependent peptidase